MSLYETKIKKVILCKECSDILDNGKAAGIPQSEAERRDEILNGMRENFNPCAYWYGDVNRFEPDFVECECCGSDEFQTKIEKILIWNKPLY